MKPDLVFLILVLAAGGLGLYLNTKNSHDYLEELKPKPKSSTPKNGVERKSSPSVSVVPLAVETPEFKRKANQFSGIGPTNIRQRWYDLFNEWERLVEENITERSRLNTVESAEPCSFAISYFDGREIAIDLNASSAFRNGSSIEFSDKNEQFITEVTNFLKPVSVMFGTQKLYDFCYVANRITE